MRTSRWAWVVGVLFVVAAVGVSGWLIGTAALGDRAATRPPIRSVTEMASRDVARVGFVRLVTEPPGATVRVDGRATAESTPTVLSLEPGPHRLELTLADHTPLSSSVTVVRGATASVRAPMSRLPGRLSVASRPEGATVSIEGREVGRTPLELGDLPRRDVAVRIAADGRAPHVETAPLSIRVEHRIDVALQRREAFGTLDVSSSPWARVTVDGRAVADSTPVLGLRLSVGRHSVVLTNPAIDWTERRSVTIRDGERTSLVVRRRESETGGGR